MPLEKTETHVWREGSARVRLLALWGSGQREVSLQHASALRLGRAPECEVVLDHASVSRHHATLRVDQQGACTLEDAGSANGTRVNGQPLAPGVARLLGPGDIAELGSTTVSVVGAESTSPGAAPALEAMLALIAPSHLSVLIVGETGVGKERVAEQLQAASQRPRGPFVRVNCAGFTETLLESELFGHTRGAFTGAVSDSLGLLAAANGGTLFLDEVGEMTAALQAKLLRVIETRRVRPVGGIEERAVDVRFLSATHRDLGVEVEAGRFRKDLYFRLNGVTVQVPPLRERRDEIPRLARSFCAQAAAQARVHEPSFTPAGLALLLRHDWPGNVRELKNAVERAVVLSNGRPISPDHLMLESGTSAAARAGSLPDALASEERQRIEQALVEAHGNQTRAAELLGIARRTLVKKLTQHGFDRPRKK